MFYAYTRPKYQVSVYRTIGPLLCKCENKGTDQCFCFHYIYSTIVSSSNIRFQASSHLLSGCSAGFVPNLVRNPKDRFSHDTAEVNLTLTGTTTPITDFKVTMQKDFTCLQME